jgi:hypothetical protein
MHFQSFKKQKKRETNIYLDDRNKMINITEKENKLADGLKIAF